MLVAKHVRWVGLLFSVGVAFAVSLLAGATSVAATTATTARTGMSALQTLVKTAENRQTKFLGPSSSPPALKHKLVVSIPCSLASVGCARVDAGVAAAAKAIGWRERTIDPEGQPALQRNAVTTAVQLHANAIVDIGINPTTIAAQLAVAHAAGIAAIGAQVSGVGLDASSSTNGVKVGKIAGAYMAVASHGTAKVGVFNDPSYPVDVQLQDGMEDSLRECSGCKLITTLNFSIADAATTYPAQISSTLQANPDMTYAFGVSDGEGGPIVPVVQQLGKTQQVAVVSTGGGLQEMDWVHTGQMKAEVAASYEQSGWGAVDQANRILSRKPPARSEGIATRLITKANVGPYVANAWKGDANYAAAYKKIWGRG